MGSSTGRSRSLLYALVVAVVLLVLFLVVPSQNARLQAAVPSDYNPRRLWPAQQHVERKVAPEIKLPSVPAIQQQAQQQQQQTLGAENFDYFQNFRKRPGCNTTSQELHYDFEPKCQDKESVMKAMAGGGRHGFDRPYSTLDCDMQWFTTDEICKIMAKFDYIHFVGDSLIRQILLAMHIFMREDLFEGGRTTWRDDNPEDQDCRCRTLFNKGSKCFLWEAVDTDSIIEHDPKSLKCGTEGAKLELTLLQAIEIVPDHIGDLTYSIKEHLKKPGHKGRNVYIFGAGSWNQYRVPDTKEWIRLVEDELRNEVPQFFDSPRLWVSPGSQAENKDPRYIDAGNNIRVQKHVHAMGPHVRELGYDHLAVYNLTVQASSPDGTHTTLESTLLEAMMILNWLYYV